MTFQLKTTPFAILRAKVLRGGRMTKWKGRAASIAPFVGAVILAAGLSGGPVQAETVILNSLELTGDADVAFTLDTPILLQDDGDGTQDFITAISVTGAASTTGNISINLPGAPGTVVLEANKDGLDVFDGIVIYNEGQGGVTLTADPGTVLDFSDPQDANSSDIIDIFTGGDIVVSLAHTSGGVDLRSRSGSVTLEFGEFFSEWTPDRFAINGRDDIRIQASTEPTEGRSSVITVMGGAIDNAGGIGVRVGSNNGALDHDMDVLVDVGDITSYEYGLSFVSGTNAGDISITTGDIFAVDPRVNSLNSNPFDRGYTAVGFYFLSSVTGDTVITTGSITGGGPGVALENFAGGTVTATTGTITAYGYQALYLSQLPSVDGRNGAINWTVNGDVVRNGRRAIGTSGYEFGGSAVRAYSRTPDSDINITVNGNVSTYTDPASGLIASTGDNGIKGASWGGALAVTVSGDVTSSGWGAYVYANPQYDGHNPSINLDIGGSVTAHRDGFYFYSDGSLLSAAEEINLDISVSGDVTSTASRGVYVLDQDRIDRNIDISIGGRVDAALDGISLADARTAYVAVAGLIEAGGDGVRITDSLMTDLTVGSISAGRYGIRIENPKTRYRVNRGASSTTARPGYRVFPNASLTSYDTGAPVFTKATVNIGSVSSRLAALKVANGETVTIIMTGGEIVSEGFRGYAAVGELPPRVVGGLPTIFPVLEYREAYAGAATIDIVDAGSLDLTIGATSEVTGSGYEGRAIRIASVADAHIENSGTVCALDRMGPNQHNGQYGSRYMTGIEILSVDDGLARARIENADGASIEGTEAAILVSDGSGSGRTDVTVFNEGSIAGDVRLGRGDDNVTNRIGGTIDGNVVLGSGDDVFVTWLSSSVAPPETAGSASGGNGIDTVGLGVEAGDSVVVSDFRPSSVLGGIDGFELAAKFGAGSLAFAPDADPGLQGIEVMDGFLSIEEDVHVRSGGSVTDDRAGRVAIRTSLDADLETTLRARAGLTADTGIVMEAGTRLETWAFATGPARTEAGGTGVTGDAGSQTVVTRSDVSVDRLAGVVTVNHLATLDAVVDLGAGDDAVVNRFGAFTQDVRLGAGNDALEIFLQPDAGGGTPTLGGTFQSDVVDGGLGTDELRFSLEAGEVSLTQAFEDAIDRDKFTSFETLGKGGAGNVIFALDVGTDGRTTRANIEGSAELDGAFQVTEDLNDPGSGVLRLAADPEGETTLIRVGVDGSTDAQGGVVMEGDLTFAIAGVFAAPSVTGDGGNQIVEIAASADIGEAEGFDGGGAGSDADLFEVSRADGDSLTIADGDVVDFETVALNTEADATGRFTIATGAGETAFEGAETVTLHRGTLGGVGTIDGNVTIGGAGEAATLAAGNSPGTLVIAGDLTLTSDAATIFELPAGPGASFVGGGFNDLIEVGGALTLGGDLVIADWNPLDTSDTFYTLFTYNVADGVSGSFAGTNLAGTGWSVVSGVPIGEVRLVFSSTPGGGTFLYWDGGATDDATIEGGDGIWTASDANWTEADGNPNGAWSQNNAYFTANGGIVELDTIPSFDRLIFENYSPDETYVLSDEAGPAGGLQLRASGSAIFVADDLSAEIAVEMSDINDDGFLIKEEGGRLLLSQANTHGSGTALVGGTLAVGNSQALGSGSLAMSDGTVLEAAAADLTLANEIVIGGPGDDRVTIDTVDNELTLSGPVTGGAEDRVAKAGAGTLVLAGVARFGGLDLTAGQVAIIGTTTLDDAAAEGDVAMGADTDLEIGKDGTLTAPGAVTGDAGAQGVRIAGTLDAAIDLGDGADRVALFSTGTLSGPAEGGAGDDSLSIDRAEGDTLTVSAGDFTGFETVDLNFTGDATGTFALDDGAFAGVFGSEQPGSSMVTLHRGMLAGNGRILGNLDVLGVLSPGNSIGLIDTVGNLTVDGGGSFTSSADTTGVLRIEYRVPVAGDYLATGSGDALFGRSTVFGLTTPAAGGGSVALAASLADQDADLVRAGGTATLTGGAGIVLSALDTDALLQAAIADPANTAGEVRWLVLRAESGGTGALSGVALGGVTLEYQDDLGNVIATSADATDLTTGWTNIVLVAEGSGGFVPGSPQIASFSLRPERVNAGCLPGQVLLFNEEDLSADGTCIWFDVTGTQGSADISGGLTEDLSEWQFDLGAELRIGEAPERPADASGRTETRLGVFLGYRETQLEYNTGASSDIDTTRVGLYADLARGRTDLAFSLIWADHDVATTRFGLLDGSRIDGNYGAQTLTFNAEATRWTYIDPCWDLGWVAGLTWATGDRDAYTETGSALESFRFGAESGDALWATLGVKARYRSHDLSGHLNGAVGATPTDFNLFAGIDALVSGNPALGANGQYLGDPLATSLSAPGGSRWEETALRIEGDVAMKLSEATTLSAGLGGRFTSSTQDYSANLNVKWQW